MENHIASYKKALSNEECSELINYFTEFPRKIIKGPVNEKTKNTGDFIYDALMLNVRHKAISNALIKNVKEYIDRYPFLKVVGPTIAIDDSCILQKYKPGNNYKWEHCENSALKSRNRVLAWMFYLNDIFEEGGGTVFPQQNITLKAREGDLYIWPAGWTHSHYGLPAMKGCKYIVTGWCKYLED